MNVHETTLPMFDRCLGNLDRWLELAGAHAVDKKFSPDVLAAARLAPDMFPLSGQVQLACDAAKYAACKLAGVEAPSIADTETTLDELRARIATCRAHLATFRPEQFAGAEERLLQHRWMEGRSLRGPVYLREYAIPNFFFHLAMAYAILRHNGVPVGKMDYLGALSFER